MSIFTSCIHRPIFTLYFPFQGSKIYLWYWPAIALLHLKAEDRLLGEHLVIWLTEVAVFELRTVLNYALHFVLITMPYVHGGLHA